MINNLESERNVDGVIPLKFIALIFSIVFTFFGLFIACFQYFEINWIKGYMEIIPGKQSEVVMFGMLIFGVGLALLLTQFFAESYTATWTGITFAGTLATLYIFLWIVKITLLPPEGQELTSAVIKDEVTARAVGNKGITLGQGGDRAAEIKAYDAVIARFGDSDDAQLQVQTAMAMINKGITLGQGGDTAAELEAYNEVIARFGDSDDAQLQGLTAISVVKKGITLDQGGDTAAALEAFDAVIARFGDNDDAQLQVLIASAMVFKGIALDQGGDMAAALEAFDAVIVRFGDSDDAQLQALTAAAMALKGGTLGPSVYRP